MPPTKVVWNVRPRSVGQARMVKVALQRHRHRRIAVRARWVMPVDSRSSRAGSGTGAVRAGHPVLAPGGASGRSCSRSARSQIRGIASLAQQIGVRSPVRGTIRRLPSAPGTSPMAWPKPAGIRSPHGIVLWLRAIPNGIGHAAAARVKRCGRRQIPARLRP
jgi:hypothetical protein